MNENAQTPEDSVSEAPSLNSLERIVLEKVDYGYIVKVGCKTIVFEKPESLISNLTEYLNDPRSTTLKWNKIFDNEN